jgi:hypothetical protein
MVSSMNDQQDAFEMLRRVVIDRYGAHPGHVRIVRSPYEPYSSTASG